MGTNKIQTNKTLGFNTKSWFQGMSRRDRLNFNLNQIYRSFRNLEDRRVLNLSELARNIGVSRQSIHQSFNCESGIGLNKTLTLCVHLLSFIDLQHLLLLVLRKYFSFVDNTLFCEEDFKLSSNKMAKKLREKTDAKGKFSQADVKGVLYYLLTNYTFLELEKFLDITGLYKLYLERVQNSYKRQGGKINSRRKIAKKITLKVDFLRFQVFEVR